MRTIITSPTTVEELIKSLEGLPQEALIGLRNDDTGEKFIIDSLDLVDNELVIINIEENIDEEVEEEEAEAA